MDGSVTFGGTTYENAEEFEISATHDQTSDNPTLTALNVSLKDWTTSTNDGMICGSIIDKKGSTLPETGGMGTTLLYAAGGVLVAMAAVYVIMNKRKHSEEK
jgi:LPXTG-motif cell wall-anchored protein